MASAGVAGRTWSRPRSERKTFSMALGITRGSETIHYNNGAQEIEERFLTSQADRLAGARREEKASARSVRNDTLCLGVSVSTAPQGRRFLEGRGPTRPRFSLTNP